MAYLIVFTAGILFGILFGILVAALFELASRQFVDWLFRRMGWKK